MANDQNLSTQELLNSPINATVGSEIVTNWAAGVAQDAVSGVTNVAVPGVLRRTYAISVLNPTESIVNVRVYIKETFNSAAKWSYLYDFDVPASPDASNPAGATENSAVTKLIQGCFLGGGIGLSFSPTSAPVAANASKVLRTVIREVE